MQRKERIAVGVSDARHASRGPQAGRAHAIRPRVLRDARRYRSRVPAAVSGYFAAGAISFSSLARMAGMVLRRYETAASKVEYTVGVGSAWAASPMTPR